MTLTGQKASLSAQGPQRLERERPDYAKWSMPTEQLGLNTLFSLLNLVINQRDFIEKGKDAPSERHSRPQSESLVRASLQSRHRRKVPRDVQPLFSKAPLTQMSSRTPLHVSVFPSHSVPEFPGCQANLPTLKTEFEWEPIDRRGVGFRKRSKQ